MVWVAWECRLCEHSSFTRAMMSEHLEQQHGIRGGLDADLRIALEHAKDSPESAENTFCYYDMSQRLLAVHRQIVERAIDDPMRFA